MDASSLFFVVLMVAIGGISAYVADILGYKIGKKRLSIKRIRPKYVARISVVIAGMLIPLVTIALLYAASSDFRTWLTRGSQVVKDLENKSREVDKMNVKLVDGEKKNAELDNTKNIIEAKLKTKQAEAKAQETKAKELNDQVRSLTENINSYKLEKEKALASLEPIKAKLTTLQKQLPEAQNSLILAKKNLLDAESKFKDASSKYNQTSTRNLQLTNENAGLSKKNDEIKKASDDLKSVIDVLNKDLEKLKSEKALAESEKNRINEELIKASQNLETIIAEANTIIRTALEDKDKFYRTQTISFLRGEELARFSVSPKPSASEAASAFRAVLRRAKSMAVDHGAQSSQNYPFPGAAGIIKGDSLSGYLSESEVEKVWVDQLTKSSSNTVLIASALTNRFASEPVTLDLVALPNPIVFRKGEIVTESKIDGRLSEIEVLNGIREFLRTFVNLRARQRNMIPVHGRDGDSYGEFTQDQLLSTVVKVKAAPRIARIVAVAKQDIRAGDALDIDIEVR